MPSGVSHTLKTWVRGQILQAQWDAPRPGKTCILPPARCLNSFFMPTYRPAAAPAAWETPASRRNSAFCADRAMPQPSTGTTRAPIRLAKIEAKPRSTPSAASKLQRAAKKVTAKTCASAGELGSAGQFEFPFVHRSLDMHCRMRHCITLTDLKQD